MGRFSGHQLAGAPWLTSERCTDDCEIRSVTVKLGRLVKRLAGMETVEAAIPASDHTSRSRDTGTKNGHRHRVDINWPGLDGYSSGEVGGAPGGHGNL